MIRDRLERRSPIDVKTVVIEISSRKQKSMLPEEDVPEEAGDGGTQDGTRSALLARSDRGYLTRSQFRLATDHFIRLT